MDRQATQVAGSPFPHRIHNSLLLAACADTIAAPLRGTTLPSPTDIDSAIISKPAQAGLSHQATHLLLTAEHLAVHDGTLDEDSLAWTLAATS